MSSKLNDNRTNIGHADFVIVHDSLEQDTLVTQADELDIPDGAVVHFIPIELVFELQYNMMEYPINPKIFAIGEQASESLKGVVHEKVDYLSNNSKPNLH